MSYTKKIGFSEVAIVKDYKHNFVSVVGGNGGGLYVYKKLFQ